MRIIYLFFLILPACYLVPKSWPVRINGTFVDEKKEMYSKCDIGLFEKGKSIYHSTLSGAVNRNIPINPQVFKPYLLQVECEGAGNKFQSTISVEEIKSKEGKTLGTIVLPRKLSK